MIRAYPHGVLLNFSGFPSRIRVFVGESGAALIPGASMGSSFVLEQTPNSSVVQGELETNTVLPSKRVIYSDTGSDDDYKIKVSFSCYGVFLVENKGDSFLTFQVFKSVIIETPENDPVEHSVYENHYTSIPVTIDMSIL